MYTCASCKIHGCKTGDFSNVPKNCPCLEKDDVEKIKKYYAEEENKKIAYNAALVEAEGYCKKTRVEEIIDFAKKCGYKKIGLAFCIGLSKEAEVFQRILIANGFEVNSIICKNGSVPKEFMGIKEDEKVRPCTYEPMCNPIGQAEFLNKSNTDLNILLGLCVGHDTLFIKHSNAPITVLGVKDRVLAHNPIAALYMADGYYKNRMFPEGK